LTVISGSLPRAAPSGTYARLLREGRRLGAQVLLDCDGPAFAAGVKARPFLVKPNRFELALWAGRELKGIKALRAAARGLSTATGGWVLASMDAGGAMLVNTGEAFHLEARAPSVAARNEVGAGDALLARVAYEVERGAPPTEWLRAGVGTGTAYVQMPAGRLPGKAMIRRTIGEVELNRP
jgi:6-phosphofructokinase 2